MPAKGIRPKFRPEEVEEGIDVRAEYDDEDDELVTYDGQQMTEKQALAEIERREAKEGKHFVVPDDEVEESDYDSEEEEDSDYEPMDEDEDEEDTDMEIEQPKRGRLVEKIVYRYEKPPKKSAQAALSKPKKAHFAQSVPHPLV